MPPEETEAHIGEIYRLFNENFAKIKVLLAENKKQQIESLITVDREQLYREVFGKNVSLVL